MSWFGIADGVMGMIGSVLDKVVPDAAERDKIKAEMYRLQREGELKELETRMSAILAEAKSEDPWTSRARPTFMYVIYILILASLPMGVLSAFRPDLAFSISDGFNNWLTAIPSDLIALFGVGYVGYAGARSIEKIKGAGKP